MFRDEYDSYLDWWCHNQEEYEAFIDAEDGEPKKLAELIMQRGFLRTREAREFVSKKLLGLPVRQGRKRTRIQMSTEFIIFTEILKIMRELKCSEYAAKKVYLDQNPDLNEETLKTYIRNSKELIKKMKS